VTVLAIAPTVGKSIKLAAHAAIRADLMVVLILHPSYRRPQHHLTPGISSSQGLA
jgi:hypothetical protein